MNSLSNDYIAAGRGEVLLLPIRTTLFTHRVEYFILSKRIIKRLNHTDRKVLSNAPEITNLVDF